MRFVTGLILLTMLILLNLLGAIPSAVHASEESQALGARAMIEIDAGRTSEGMDLLDRAVGADPTDAGVLYHRGALRAKLGDYTGAIRDLRAALVERPYFPQASLELGAALNEIGKPVDAIPRLLEAQSEPALDAQASFFLGVAQLRLNQLDEAQASFERVHRLDSSLDLSVQYYGGVIAYRRHDHSTAEAIFVAVQKADPDAPIARESARYLELIRRAGQRNYGVYGSVGLEYDSNVTLSPGTTIPGAISEESDGRFVMTAGGTYLPLESGPFRLSLSYQFLQTLHFNLTQYNLQDHRPTIQLTANHGTLTFGFQGRYDYYLLDVDSYMQEVTAFPWLTIREPAIGGHLDIYYRMQWRDFKQLSFAVLDGYYHSIGARQFIDLDRHGRQVWLGYEFRFNEPDGRGQDEFKFRSQQADVGLLLPLPFQFSGEASYRFEYQKYADASGVFEPIPDERKDHDHRIIVSFERPLTQYLTAVATYFGTFNTSNKDAFEYDRHIGSIGLEMAF